MSQWDNQVLVTDYANMVKSPELSWFEDTVNIPALMEMMPVSSRRVLDFGCGPGEFTSKLQATFPQIEGCDASEQMTERAMELSPAINFFVWDGLSKKPKSKHLGYELIIAKLVLEFVPNLDVLARNLHETTADNGSLVVSFQHPIRTTLKQSLSYWDEVTYKVEIGSSGIQVDKIQRSLSSFISPFLNAGYVLDFIQEPKIPLELLSKYHAPEGYDEFPLRLNLRFKRVTSLKS